MSIRLTKNGTHGQGNWGYSGTSWLAHKTNDMVNFEYFWLPIPNTNIGATGTIITNLQKEIDDVKDQWNDWLLDQVPSTETTQTFINGRGADLDSKVSQFGRRQYNYNAFKMAIYKDTTYGTSGAYRVVYENAPGSYDYGSFAAVARNWEMIYGATSDVIVYSNYSMDLDDLETYSFGLPVFNNLQDAVEYITDDNTDPSSDDDPYSSLGPNTDIVPSQTFKELNYQFLNSLSVLAEVPQTSLDAIGGALNNQIDVSQDMGTNIMKIVRSIIQGNISEGIMSIKLVPIPQGSNLPYTSGNFEPLFEPLGAQNVTGKKLSQYLEKYDIGQIEIKPIFNDYRDYMTEYSIYLPYSGIHKLDADIIVDHTLIIQADIDFICGTILYHLIIDDNRNTRDIYQFTGNCAVEIPITAKDFTGKYQAIMSGIFTGIGTMAGGAMAGPPGMAMAMASTGMSMVGNAGLTPGQYIESGKLVSNSSALSIVSPYLIISKPQEETPNISSTKGRPCHKVKNLSSCSGFTTITNIRLDNIPYATDEDKAALKSMLASGVYL